MLGSDSPSSIPEVVEIFSWYSVFHQYIDCLLECEPEGALGPFSPFEVVSWELLLNSFNLLLILVAQATENMLEHAIKHFHNLVVMLFDCHLKIKSNKLGHMAVGIGIFGTEYRSNLVDSFKIGSDGHLFRELG